MPLERESTPGLLDRGGRQDHRRVRHEPPRLDARQFSQEMGHRIVILPSRQSAVGSLH
ncbi:MAG: hypothetical protein LC793_02255 [Thermomicrobia bacterium]|nr:hypothetical protein [Thermomicrobia bacterium]